MVELLTVVAIIAMLIGLLIPAVTMVRKIAKETQQEAQLTQIDLALLAFKGDCGDYPPSEGLFSSTGNDYCGAQKLAEALLGRDLLGFHPGSNWSATDQTFYPDNLSPTNPADLENLNARRERYLELGSANAFRLGITAAGKHDGLFDNPAPLEEKTFVLCDVFGIKRITQGEKTVKAGTPILYYRANTSSKNFDAVDEWEKRIYNAYDNLALIALGKVADVTEKHRLANEGGEFFYSPDYKIIDPKVSTDTLKWPYRPDSYILISAGADGEYGTSDDICNF